MGIRGQQQWAFFLKFIPQLPPHPVRHSYCMFPCVCVCVSAANLTTCSRNVDCQSHVGQNRLCLQVVILLVFYTYGTSKHLKYRIQWSFSKHILICPVVSMESLSNITSVQLLNYKVIEFLILSELHILSFLASYFTFSKQTSHTFTTMCINKVQLG